MAHTNIPAQTALANVFLHSFKTAAERNHAITDIAKQVDNETIGLVAALTAGVSVPKAEESLQAFLTRGIEEGDPSVAASVALQYPHIREPLVRRAANELDTSLALLLSRPRNSGIVIPAPNKDSSTVSLDHLELDDQSSRSSQDIIHLTVAYLKFLRQVFRISTREQSFPIPQTAVITVLSLIAASDTEIASEARDACFAFLAAYKTKAVTMSDVEGDSDTLVPHLWSCVDALLDHSPHSSYRTTAYAMWLRWLENSQSEGSFEDLMQSDKYWAHLLDALASGDVEQRKLCLHILRASVANPRKSISTKDMVFNSTEHTGGPDSVLTHYERFCTVYETIVIGRYFNQAEECIRDLDALASSQTRVQESWLFALLEPAMSNVVQDSIRKMLGNWLMSTDLKVSTHVKEFTRFLRNSFLPWACLGQLYTGTLRGRTRAIKCEHGTRLASFVERLIKNHSADDQTEVRLCITQSILTFLHHNKAKVIPYAVVFLLYGLVQGLRGTMKPCMGTAELEILLDLPTGTAYPEISRDVLQGCCLALAQLSAQNTTGGSIDTVSEDLRLDTMTRRVQQIEAGPASDQSITAPRWQSLEDYLEELRTSRHNCLSGEGLAAACRALIVLLDTLSKESLKSNLLCPTLESIWTGLEIQDYPKSVLLILPSLVLHAKVVECTLHDEELSAMVESYIFQLHQFATGRIYVWSPFMTAFRKALIISPAAAHKFATAELIIATANNPPSAKVEFQLEAAIVHLLPGGGVGRSYIDYYGEHEEVGYAAFFDLVNRLPFINENTARETYEKLIEPWANQKLPVPVVNKWKTTVQLQVMIILQEQMLKDMTLAQAQSHMDVLHRILAVEPLPRHRLLIEWQIARTIIRHTETNNDILRRLSTMDHHSNPKYLSSLAKVGVMIACLEDCPEEFAASLSCRLVALSASSKIIIRHEAQWSFPILWDSAQSHRWASITDNPSCQALNEYIRSLQQFSTPPTERLLEQLDPVSGHTLAKLLGGKYLRLEPPTAATVSALDIERFLEKNQQSELDCLPSSCLPLGDLGDSELSKANEPQPVETQEESKASARTAATTALQTKGGAYLSANSTKNEDTDRATDLIVVGSLVDNAYNLGGLSRISEIFGASALYMSRPKVVLGNKDFVSVAVASQNHLPIHDLSVENIQAFLTEKKTQGYTVVGVEQTDRSVMLGDKHTKLPAKTLLVMGAEKEGIPAMVLGECDILVEVPQRGVTRSMNVQTAAGVVLYEYSRQHPTR